MSERFAFVFPGQGSQHLGMLKEVAEKYPSVIDTFRRASDELGYDLWKLVQEGPEDRLNETEHTQPALLASGVAMWELWRELQGPRPAFMAGHSLGEYTALVCANAITFKDAISLVAKRGRYMQQAVPVGEGGMAAIIGLENEAIEDICREASSDKESVAPANYNSMGQVVIAGSLGAIDKSVQLAKERGAKLAKKLAMSVPSHCVLMKPAAQKLAEDLKTISFRHPELPVIHNVDVCAYQEGNQIAQALIRQLYSPVRWVETIQLLAKNQVRIVIESGPGKVLTGLNKRIDNHLIALALCQPEAFHEALAQVSEQKVQEV